MVRRTTILPIIFLALLPIGYLLYNYGILNLKDFTTYLFVDVVAIMISAIVDWFMRRRETEELAQKFAEKKQKLEDEAQRRKMLTDRLHEVYKKWLGVYASEGDGYQLVFQTHYDGYNHKCPVSKLSYIKWAEAYLKDKHSEIYKPWSEANVFVEEYNKFIPATISSLKERIRADMKQTYPSLTEENDPSPKSQNYYYMPHLFRSLHQLFSHYARTGRIFSYDFKKKKEDNRWRLDSDGYHYIMSEFEEDADPVRLRKIFESILGDTAIVEQFRKLDKIYTNVGNALKQFSALLKELVDKIDLGFYVIELD